MKLDCRPDSPPHSTSCTVMDVMKPVIDRIKPVFIPLFHNPPPAPLTPCIKINLEDWPHFFITLPLEKYIIFVNAERK